MLFPHESRGSDGAVKQQQQQTERTALFSLPSCDPEEEETIVLQGRDAELPHLVVRQRTVRQLHVNIPRRVGHHHGKLTQDGHVQVANVAADPLRITTDTLSLNKKKKI